MRLRVGWVDELAKDDGALDLLVELLRLGDGALHSLCAFGQYDLRTVGLQQVAAFHTHGVRQGQDRLVTLSGSYGSQPDARVAGGRLDDGGAWFQEPLLLRVLDHGEGYTVLDGTGRVEVFQLR